MVSFQTKDLKLSYTKLALLEGYLSLKSHVKGELFPLIDWGRGHVCAPDATPLQVPLCPSADVWPLPRWLCIPPHQTAAPGRPHCQRVHDGR